MLTHNLRVSNGVASYAMNYYRKLDRDTVRMDFAVFSDVPTPYYEEIRRTGGEVYIIPSLKKRPADHVKECRKVLDRGYDVIHDNCLLDSIPMMYLAKRKKVPVRLLHSHNSRLGETRGKELRNRIITPLLVACATDFAACSELAAKAMFGNKVYSFIPNFIEERRVAFSEDRRTEIRNAMGVHGRLVIGTVGRVAPQKNPIFALDVIAQLIKIYPDLRYWWIGSGVMDKELKEAVENKDLQNNVDILGSREDVSDLYQAMDVFFLPSLFEGLPVTGVEAQAAGLPSVISDSVTKEMVFTDLIEFVDLNDPVDKWIEAFRHQISRISERRSHISELRNSVFSEDSAGERLTAVYISLLSEKNKQSR